MALAYHLGLALAPGISGRGGGAHNSLSIAPPPPEAPPSGSLGRGGGGGVVVSQPHLSKQPDPGGSLTRGKASHADRKRRPPPAPNAVVPGVRGGAGAQDGVLRGHGPARGPPWAAGTPPSLWGKGWVSGRQRPTASFIPPRPIPTRLFRRKLVMHRESGVIPFHPFLSLLFPFGLPSRATFTGIETTKACVNAWIGCFTGPPLDSTEPLSQTL